jgi:hypothetical protein
MFQGDEELDWRKDAGIMYVDDEYWSIIKKHLTLIFLDPQQPFFNEQFTTMPPSYFDESLPFADD